LVLVSPEVASGKDASAIGTSAALRFRIRPDRPLFARIHCRRRPIEKAAFPGISCVVRWSDRLLAMQKVVGSSPISRFEEALQIAGFFVSRT
jgi:hypothetical protein